MRAIDPWSLDWGNLPQNAGVSPSARANSDVRVCESVYLDDGQIAELIRVSIPGVGEQVFIGVVYTKAEV